LNHEVTKIITSIEQHRPDVQDRRNRWRVMQAGIDPDRFVFLDETWDKTNMTRTRGRAPRHERVVSYTPHGHWKTTTFLAALRTTGLIAPLVVDGVVNGEIFPGYIEQHLGPALHPRDIVVMDNL